MSGIFYTSYPRWFATIPTNDSEPRRYRPAEKDEEVPSGWEESDRPSTGRGFEDVAKFVLPVKVHRLLNDDVYFSQLKTLKLYPESQDYIQEVGVLTESDWEKIQSVVTNASGSADESGLWMERLREGSWDALAAATLYLVQDVEELEIEGLSNDYRGKYDWFHQVIARGSAINTESTNHPGTKFGLPKLYKVFLAYADTEFGLKMAEVVRYAGLVSSIKVLYVHMVNQEDWEPQTDLTFSLEDVTFNYSALDAVSMANFIRCCPNLRKFNYNSDLGVVGTATFIPPELGPGLDHLKDCLEELCINGQDDFGDTDESENPLRSFKDFSRLHTIHLGASMLVGSEDADLSPYEDEEENALISAKLVDTLPKCLESLSLYKCEAGMIQQLDELVDNLENTTPALKLIRCTGFRKEQVDDLERLKGKFEAKGITLKLSTQ